MTVVLDRSQRSERYTSATFVANAGIPTYIDAKHAIAYDKIMIIDRATLITGSFNFTKAAEEKNAENLLVIKGDAGLVKKYLANLEEHLGIRRSIRGEFEKNQCVGDQHKLLFRKTVSQAGDVGSNSFVGRIAWNGLYGANLSLHHRCGEMR